MRLIAMTDPHLPANYPELRERLRQCIAENPEFTADVGNDPQGWFHFAFAWGLSKDLKGEARAFATKFHAEMTAT